MQVIIKKTKENFEFSIEDSEDERYECLKDFFEHCYKEILNISDPIFDFFFIEDSPKYDCSFKIFHKNFKKQLIFDEEESFNEMQKYDYYTKENFEKYLIGSIERFRNWFEKLSVYEHKIEIKNK